MSNQDVLKKLEEHDRRFEAIDQRFEAIDHQLLQVREDLHDLSLRSDQQGSDIKKILDIVIANDERYLRDQPLRRAVEDHEHRIAALESKSRG